MHRLEYPDQLELHLGGRGQTVDHRGQLSENGRGKGFGLFGERGGCDDGGLHLHFVVGIQGATDGVMDGRTLGHDPRHFAQQTKSDAASNGIVTVNHLEDSANKFIHVDDLVQVALRKGGGRKRNVCNQLPCRTTLNYVLVIWTTLNDNDVICLSLHALPGFAGLL